jgi:hypothetical protein
MKVELRRAMTPGEVGEEVPCGICGESFDLGSVMAFATTDHDGDIGQLCAQCVAVMGRYLPERFPSLKEYTYATMHYPEPVYASMEEADRAVADGTDVDNYRAGWLGRSFAESTGQLR